MLPFKVSQPSQSCSSAFMIIGTLDVRPINRKSVAGYIRSTRSAPSLILVNHFPRIVSEKYSKFIDAYKSARDHILSGKTFEHLKNIQNG